MRIICVLALDEVIAFDLATAVEIFRRVVLPDGEPAYTVLVAGPNPSVRSGPITIGVPNDLGALRNAETVIIPGRDDPTAPIDESVIQAIRDAHALGSRIASICVGAFDLASTGLLNGLSATTHWNAAGLLAERFPLIDVKPSVLFVDEGSLLTSAGASAGLDLCLHMIETDLGAAVALDAARLAVAPVARSGGQAQFIARSVHPTPESSLSSVLEWMNEHLADPLRLSDIATVAHLSVRTLSRHFQERLGTSPMGWLKAQRMRMARSLLETTNLSVELVAEASGFGSAANLRTQMMSEVNTGPTAYRRAFRTGMT